MTLPVVWAIGGIDPSGGAGIYQDLKVMSWSGVHPMGIPVALTSQNIDHVREV
ncbi:Phosphomethylpyrimidine kinase type-1 domain protein, partial [mine drainage metagenome]